jgi:hypothetical protein
MNITWVVRVRFSAMAQPTSGIVGCCSPSTSKELIA